MNESGTTYNSELKKLMEAGSDDKIKAELDRMGPTEAVIQASVTDQEIEKISELKRAQIAHDIDVLKKIVKTDELNPAASLRKLLAVDNIHMPQQKDKPAQKNLLDIADRYSEQLEFNTSLSLKEFIKLLEKYQIRENKTIPQPVKPYTTWSRKGIKNHEN